MTDLNKEISSLKMFRPEEKISSAYPKKKKKKFKRKHFCNLVHFNKETSILKVLYLKKREKRNFSYLPQKSIFHTQRKKFPILYQKHFFCLFEKNKFSK